MTQREEKKVLDQQEYEVLDLRYFSSHNNFKKMSKRQAILEMYHFFKFTYQNIPLGTIKDVHCISTYLLCKSLCPCYDVCGYKAKSLSIKLIYENWKEVYNKEYAFENMLKLIGD